MKKLLLLNFCLMMVSWANAQISWNDGNVNWNYTMSPEDGAPLTYKGGDVTAMQSGAVYYSQSYTTKTEAGFMPKALSGTIRIQATGNASAITGSYTIEKGSPNVLDMPIAEAGGTPVNKLAFYGIEQASPVMNLNFTLDLTKTPSTLPAGGIYLAIGNEAGASNIFTNNGSVSSANTPQYFAIFQWLFASNGSITLRTRQNGATYPNISTTAFVNGGGPYNIEVYANNWTAGKKYTRQGAEHELPAGCLHFWVNGTQLSLSGNNNIPRCEDTMPAKTTLSAFTVVAAKQNQSGQTNNSTYDGEKLKLSNININYLDNATLPVELTSFTSKLIDQNKVELSWTTASEKDNKSFEIYRSGDDYKFLKIGSVDGSNTSTDFIRYTFTDSNPLIGNNYYKLYQIDHNGTVNEQSKILSVKTNISQSQFKIYETSDHIINWSFISQVNTPATFYVTDIQGRKILETKVSLSEGNNMFEIKDIRPGIYVASISTGSVKKAMSFVKK